MNDEMRENSERNLDRNSEERKKKKRKRRPAINLYLLIISAVLLCIVIVLSVMLGSANKKIKAAGSVNADPDKPAVEDKAQIEKYEKEIEDLKAQLAEAKSGEAPAEETGADTEEDKKDPEEDQAEPTEEPEATEETGQTETTETGDTLVFEAPKFAPFEDPAYSQYCVKDDNFDIRNYTYESLYSYPTDVVFAGDSIIERCEWAEIYPEYSVKNRGVGGDVISGLTARMKLISYTKPKKIFILIGVNDLINGTDPQTVSDRYRTLMDTVAETLPETKVYFYSLLPVSRAFEDTGYVYNSRIESTNEDLKALCEEKGYTYIDLYNVLKGEDGYLSEEDSKDGLHISGTGYKKFKETTDSYLAE